MVMYRATGSSWIIRLDIEFLNIYYSINYNIDVLTVLSGVV